MAQNQKVDNATVVIGGVDAYDYPDCSDAFIESARWEDGTPLTDEELDELVVSEYLHSAEFAGEIRPLHDI